MQGALADQILTAKAAEAREAVVPAPTPADTTIVLRPFQFVRTLMPVVAFLLLCFLVSQYLKYELGYPSQLGLERQFNLDQENNLPTWYSSSALLLVSLLLGLIAGVKRQRRDPFTAQWIGLAVIFVGLSLDEAASIHEMVSDALEGQFHLSPLLASAWVIPGAAVVLVVGLSYLRFLAHLPAPSRWRFVLAGAIYVGGALGVEMLGAGFYSTAHGHLNIRYAVFVAVEEWMEMAGIVLFLYALTTYIAECLGTIRIVIPSLERHE